MIRDSDTQFHSPDDGDLTWAETGYFNFYIPEFNILGVIYIVHRAGLGITISDIEIIDTLGHSADDSVYSNLVNHNPLVTRAENFNLETGLSFRADSIRDYVVNYSADGVVLHLECAALMDPYDIHDPRMDPMAIEDATLAAAESGFGAGYKGHFDMTVKMRGTLQLADRTFSIDCISTMDHSWGPRAETTFPPMLWVNCHFDNGDAVQGIFSIDRTKPYGEQHTFRHGYALIDGAVRGAKAGSVRVVRPRLFPSAVEVTILDCDDREHKISGSILAHHPWLPYGNALSPISMVRWHGPNGDRGMGTYLEDYPLNKLRARDPNHYLALG